MKEHDKHSVRKVTSYIDDGGREVREFEQVFGRDKEDNSYVGVALVMMRGVHPMTGQPMQKHDAVEFNIPEATSVKKAFEMFDDLAQAEINNRQEAAQAAANAQRSKIVPAKTAPTLLGSDGKPMV